MSENNNSVLKNSTRIADYFENCAGRKALVSFITAGDPTPEHTVTAMHALVAGGTDIIELGIPFSDPEAEGPAIQKSSERALANDIKLVDVLEMVASFREEDLTTPVVLMGYLNSVLAMPNFAERASSAGVDGLIMVNLPPEEADQIRAELSAHAVDLIFLVAPTTTSQRSKYIVGKGQGFIYYVSLKGITGADGLQADEVAEKLAALRHHTQLPICVGFGIKNAEVAAQIGQFADGVVVGSALVNLMAEYPNDVQGAASALRAAASDLRAGLDGIS